MHCFHLIVPYAVLLNSAALFLKCMHYRLNWPEKGVSLKIDTIFFFMNLYRKKTQQNNFVALQTVNTLPIVVATLLQQR